MDTTFLPVVLLSLLYALHHALSSSPEPVFSNLG